MRFFSTILAKLTNISDQVEVQKADLSLLNKINQVANPIAIIVDISNGSATLYASSLYDITGTINKNCNIFLPNTEATYRFEINVTASTGGPYTIKVQSTASNKSTVTFPVIINGDVSLSGPIQTTIYVDPLGNVTSDYWTVLASNVATGYYEQNSAGNGAAMKWHWGASYYDESANQLVINGTETISVSLTDPLIYGSSSASGTISIYGTSHATPGNIILNPSGGKVGIGTISPTGILEVDAVNPAFTVVGTNGLSDAVEIAMVKNEGGLRTYGGYFLIPSGTNDLQWVSRTNLVDVARFTIIGTNGNVGIGKTNPLNKFVVSGTSGNQFAQVDAPTGSNSGMILSENGVATGYIYHLSGIDGTIIAGSGEGTIATFLTNGKVGIGTISPHSALAVVGLPIYATNILALAGGLTAGDFYRTNAATDLVCVVH
jgi:hypothetical protein